VPVCSSEGSAFMEAIRKGSKFHPKFNNQRRDYEEAKPPTEMSSRLYRGLALSFL
jgi:hypothetical protein